MVPSLAGLTVGHRIKTRAASTPLRGHSARPMFVAFISDGQILSASDGDKSIRRWTVADQRCEVVREPPVVCAVAVSPDGRWVAFAGNDGRVKLVDLEAPTKIIKSIEKHGDIISSLTFSPDSSQLASGAKDGKMLVWLSTTLEQAIGPFKGHKDFVWWLCYSPDGRKIASCDREVIQIWDTATWAKVTIDEQAWSLAWSSDCDKLYAGCTDGAIRVYDPTTRMLCASYKGHSDVVFSIVLSHSAKFFTTASWDKSVRFWEAATFQQIGPSLEHDTRVHSVSLSPDNNHLVSVAQDSNIRLWKLKDVAPDLFRDFLLTPNRLNNPPTSGIHIPFLPKLGGRRRTSNAPDPDVSRTSDHHNESDRSSVRSGNSGRWGFIDSLRPGSAHGNKHDGSRTRSPSTRGSISVYTPDSNSSSHNPMDDLPNGLHPGGRSPAASPLPELPPSPIHTRRNGSGSENAHSVLGSLQEQPDSPIRTKRRTSRSEIIREIRSTTEYDLTGKIAPDGNHPVAGGSQGDIYRGTLNINGKSVRVAIKVIKRYTAQGNDSSKQRRLRREMKLWMKLDHQNIIPLLGTTKDYGDFPAMVCPWVENGTLTFYLEQRRNELTAQRRVAIFNDVALGLQYLHSEGIVHGDISGSNILMYSNGRACIADFGLSIFATNVEASSVALTYQARGTLRWTAPELLNINGPENEGENPPKIFPTVQSDMYSFGGIVFQVLSGKWPYYFSTSDAQVIVDISKGKCPGRPTLQDVITNDQWRFMEACWSFEPVDRPSDSDMVKFAHAQLINVCSDGVTPVDVADTYLAVR